MAPSTLHRAACLLLALGVQSCHGGTPEPSGPTRPSATADAARRARADGGTAESTSRSPSPRAQGLLPEPAAACSVEGTLTASVELGDPAGPLATIAGATSARYGVLADGGTFAVLRGPGLHARGYVQSVFYPKRDVPIGGILNLWREAPFAARGARVAAGAPSRSAVVVAIPEIKGFTPRAPLPATELPCDELSTSATERPAPAPPRFYTGVQGKVLELAATPGGPVLAEARDLELAAVVGVQGGFWRLKWYFVGGEVLAWTRAAGLTPRKGSDAELVNQLLASLPASAPATPPRGVTEGWAHRCETETTLSFRKQDRAVPLLTLRPVDLQVVNARDDLSEVMFVAPEFSLATIDSAPQAEALAGVTLLASSEALASCSRRHLAPR